MRVGLMPPCTLWTISKLIVLGIVRAQDSLHQIMGLGNVGRLCQLEVLVQCHDVNHRVGCPTFFGLYETISSM